MLLCLLTSSVGLFVVLPEGEGEDKEEEERISQKRRKMNLRFSFWSIFLHSLAVMVTSPLFNLFIHHAYIFAVSWNFYAPAVQDDDDD